MSLTLLNIVSLKSIRNHGTRNARMTTTTRTIAATRRNLMTHLYSSSSSPSPLLQQCSRSFPQCSNVLQQQRQKQQHFHLHLYYNQKRTMAIYAVGEGWTGALKHENVLANIPGHFDEDETNHHEQQQQGPILIFDKDIAVGTTGEDEEETQVLKKKIHKVVAGWGCSIVLDTNGQIHMVGRPHDLLTLFRLRRMPQFVRNIIVQQSDPSDTTMVGTAISKLIGLATGRKADDIDNNADANTTDLEHLTWDIAKEYSLLHDWKELNLQSQSVTTPIPIGDTRMIDIVGGPGFMAMIGESGSLYTMGVNNRGQCGIGKISNNVWTPTPVKGITTISTNKVENETELYQDQPVKQVALGFQHGYALTKSGQVYSWGKTSRGQLGRAIDNDQDSIARPIQFDDNNGLSSSTLITQISSGHHHGVALTVDNQIYIWGKNMKVTKDNDKPEDLVLPQRLQGLPKNLKILKITSGSHHTAMLMEDGSIYAIGIASDEPIPLINPPVRLVESGILELPLKQFEAHFDRTTIIDAQNNIFQVHLWKDPSLQEYSLFTPNYVVDNLLLVDDDNDDDDDDHSKRHSNKKEEKATIRSIHRGWRHTLIVTE